MGLPQIEGILFDKALELIHDEDLLMTIAQEFAESADKQEEILQEKYQGICEENGDSEEQLHLYRVQVHSMKSSAATIGAFELSEEAKSLEYAARDHEVDFIKNVHNSFILHWREIKERLNVGLNIEGPTEPVDYLMVRQYMDLLIVAAEAMDMDKMDLVAAELKRYIFPEKEKQLVTQLLDAIFCIDYDTCIALAKELQQTIS